MKVEFADMSLPHVVEMVAMTAFERCKTLNRDSFAETKVKLKGQGVSMKVRVEVDVDNDGGER